MCNHTARKTIVAHVESSGTPLLDSAICCCCECDAGLRIASWQAAKAHATYDGSRRRRVFKATCAFCGTHVGRKEVRVLDVEGEL